MKYTPLFLLFGLPVVALAQTDVFSVTSSLNTILLRLGALFWVLAFALFIWGVVKFIANANDTAEHAKGKQFIIWGIITLLVIVSLWSIVYMMLSTFNITPGGPIQYITK